MTLVVLLGSRVLLLSLLHMCSQVLSVCGWCFLCIMTKYSTSITGHIRPSAAQVTVPAASVHLTCGWALQLPSRLQSLLYAGQWQPCAAVWWGQADAGQALRAEVMRSQCSSGQLSSLLQNLKICRVHAAILSAVEQLRLNPGSVTVLALPDHVLALCAVLVQTQVSCRWKLPSQ